MKVTQYGEWLEGDTWYNSRTAAECRQDYLQTRFGIDGYIVWAEIGEVKRVEK